PPGERARRWCRRAAELAAARATGGRYVRNRESRPTGNARPRAASLAGRRVRDSTTMSLRLLIVDDHPVVREGLRSMLAGTAIDLVGEAGTAAEAIRLGAEAAPDVVLLDLGLPDLDGL